MATEIHINEIKPDNSVFVSTSVNNIEIATTSAPAGPKGDTGEQGEAGYPAFLYDSRRVLEDQYKIGEIVFYGGNYYICIADNDAIIPGSPGAGLYWAPYSFTEHDLSWDDLTSGDVHVVPFDTSNGGPANLGELGWLSDIDSLVLKGVNNTDLEYGEKVVYHVQNQSGTLITKGTPISYAGTTGNSGRALIKPWNGATDIPSQFMGIAATNISNGSTGYVIHFGKIRGVNTNVYTAGAVLYANPTGTGLTQTRPNVTHVVVAACISSTNNGVLLIRPTIEQFHTKADVGLGNVDNTSDLNKPISTATQSALDDKSDVGHTHEWEEILNTPDIVNIENSISTIEQNISSIDNSINELQQDLDSSISVVESSIAELEEVVATKAPLDGGNF
jgi:hypothetical protein